MVVRIRVAAASTTLWATVSVRSGAIQISEPVLFWELVTLVSPTILKRLTVAQIETLHFELDKRLREKRAELMAVDSPEIKLLKRNAKKLVALGITHEFVTENIRSFMIAEQERVAEGE